MCERERGYYKSAAAELCTQVSFFPGRDEVYANSRELRRRFFSFLRVYIGVRARANEGENRCYILSV